MNYEYKYHKYKTKYLKLKEGGNLKKEIYTIGHSTHTLEEFIKILQDNGIKCLVDIRSYPGSKHVPQFNKKHLELILPKHSIKYTHILDLGGRCHYINDSKSTLHTSLKSKSFVSYAVYMMTPPFAKGIQELKHIAKKCKTAFMCSEVLWWRCHRRMIADRLAFDKWNVYHLGLDATPQPHKIWDVARLNSDNQIIYDK